MCAMTPKGSTNCLVQVTAFSSSHFLSHSLKMALPQQDLAVEQAIETLSSMVADVHHSIEGTEPLFEDVLRVRTAPET